MYRVSVAAVSLLVLAGCSVPQQEETTEKPGGGDTPAAAGDTPVEGAPTLTALVGTEESPNAFEISLTDESGEVVTELPAGEYNINVIDKTDIHNFALMGAGVEKATDVKGEEETTWVVTFEAGEYTYICEPHPSMNGKFTVT